MISYEEMLSTVCFSLVIFEEKDNDNLDLSVNYYEGGSNKS